MLITYLFCLIVQFERATTTRILLFKQPILNRATLSSQEPTDGSERKFLFPFRRRLALLYCRRRDARLVSIVFGRLAERVPIAINWQIASFFLPYDSVHQIPSIAVLFSIPNRNGAASVCNPSGDACLPVRSAKPILSAS
jgi:hypothetical protein